MSCPSPLSEKDCTQVGLAIEHQFNITDQTSRVDDSPATQDRRRTEEITGRKDPVLKWIVPTEPFAHATRVSPVTSTIPPWMMFSVPVAFIPTIKSFDDGPLASPRQ